MNKKGVELSMNLIIIAAIGLLVLVILAVLVIGAADRTNQGTKSCNLQLGQCQSASCQSEGKEQVMETVGGSKLCTNAKPYCCKVLS